MPASILDHSGRSFVELRSRLDTRLVRNGFQGKAFRETSIGYPTNKATAVVRGVVFGLFRLAKIAEFVL
jgi:hypothetical protein